MQMHGGVKRWKYVCVCVVSGLTLTMWDTQASAETTPVWRLLHPEQGVLWVYVWAHGAAVHVGGLGEPRAMEIMALLTVGNQPALADQAF